MRRALLGGAVVAAGVCAATLRSDAEVSVIGNTGPSSSATPYVTPVGAGVRTVSIFTVGDTVNPKNDQNTQYRMVGIPDGLGAFDNGDGTFTLTMNHEIASGGATRAHGANGAFVSVWKIDRTSLKVLAVNDLIRTV